MHFLSLYNDTCIFTGLEKLTAIRRLCTCMHGFKDGRKRRNKKKRKVVILHGKGGKMGKRVKEGKRRLFPTVITKRRRL